jgi:formylglycine-generating enzyme required for sulfatase activity
MEARVLRGGHWSGQSGSCRSVSRNRTASSRYHYYGFRVVVRLAQ